MQLSELIAAAGVAVRQKVGGDENIERGVTCASARRVSLV